MRENGRQLEREVVSHQGFLLVSKRKDLCFLAARAKSWMNGGFGALEKSETDLPEAAWQRNLHCRKRRASERR